MCGICGLYSPSRPPQPALVDEMRRRETGDVVAVVNGELYDVRALREQLHSLELRSPLLDRLERGKAALRRAFEPERLLADHANGRADNGHRIWTLAMLALWQRAHVDAPVTAAA